MGCGASTQPSASSNLQGTSQENGRRGQHGHEKKRKQKQICRVRPVETRLALDPAAPSSKRIVTETKRVLKGTVPGVWVKPNPENPRHFHVRILGPEGCPFEGGVFALEMFLTFDYPMQPPKMHFLTRIYHPNIDRVGRICLDILKDKWSPALQVNRQTRSLNLDNLCPVHVCMLFLSD